MNRIYINKVIEEYGCELNVRRLCDSYYIKKYNLLKKNFDELVKQLNELKEENESLKQLCEVYHIVLKGGEEDGS